MSNLELERRVKPLVWEDQNGGSYSWPLGLHYYTEGCDEEDWCVSCMVGNDDIWQGDNCLTREAAKAAAQYDYARRVLEVLQ